MSKTIRFTGADGTYIDVNRPSWQYDVDIHMPITISDIEPDGYSFFDVSNNGAYDYRILSTAKLQLPAAQKANLNSFFKSTLKGRCETVTMALGSDPTGFFPFGPDLGDSGTFSVHVLSRTQSGQLLQPWKYWEDDIALVLVPPSPAYTPARGAIQGSLQIGTITGLMAPQAGFNPASNYKYQTLITRTGTPYSQDGREASDFWETSWDQQCNNGNASVLVAFLVSTAGRTADITITTPAAQYPYGSDKLSGGSFVSRFLGSSRSKNEVIIKISHNAYNHFLIPLSFWMTQ